MLEFPEAIKSQFLKDSGGGTAPAHIKVVSHAGALPILKRIPLGPILSFPFRHPYPLSPFVILAKAGIHGPRQIFWIPTFVGMTRGRVGMTAWGLGRTKGDDLFSVGAQHDVPREITRFPKGHVKPCPYGTYEISLGTFPVNGRQAVPLRDIRDLAGDVPGQRSSSRASTEMILYRARA